MSKYGEQIYRVLFENDFREIKTGTRMHQAMGTLLWTSLFLFISKISAIKNTFSTDIWFTIFLLEYIGGIFIVWLLTALFFEYVMKILSKGGKLYTLLKLSAYTLLPYIFIAPFELLKKSSKMGYFWGTKLEILLFLWVIILYAKVLEDTYNLEKASSYMLIFLPVITLIFIFIWIIGSIFNLGYIYSV